MPLDLPPPVTAPAMAQAAEPITLNTRERDLILQWNEASPHAEKALDFILRQSAAVNQDGRGQLLGTNGALIFEPGEMRQTRSSIAPLADAPGPLNNLMQTYLFQRMQEGLTDLTEVKTSFLSVLKDYANLVQDTARARERLKDPDIARAEEFSPEYRKLQEFLGNNVDFVHIPEKAQLPLEKQVAQMLLDDGMLDLKNIAELMPEFHKHGVRAQVVHGQSGDFLHLEAAAGGHTRATNLNLNKLGLGR